MAMGAVSCAGTGENNNKQITYQADTVIIPAGSPILSKLRLETIAKEPFSSEFRTVGTVQAETGHYAEVGVPFDGRIMRARVGLGSRVGAGQVLFEVSSPEFLETCKLYFQSQSNYEKSRSDYQRKKTLQASGIISQKELNEAFTEAENARQEKEYAESAIRVYGMNPVSVKMGQPMKIVAPISGEIVKCGLISGEKRSDIPVTQDRRFDIFDGKGGIRRI